MEPKNASLVFYVNGRRVEESHPNPGQNLLYYIRKNLKLTGTKLGCGEGGCGACTVMLSKFDSNTRTVRHFSVNSCLVPLCYVHGLAVTTVEGIGSIRNGLHPVQERIAEFHGVQCGFCTPGIVMSMYSLLRNNPSPTEEEITTQLEGNLCRCTGYRPIMDGFKTFTKGYCAMGDKCCKNKNGEEGTTEDDPEETETKPSKPRKEYPPLDPTQDPIFPPELMTDKFEKQYVKFKGEFVKWFRPTTLKKLLELKSKYPTAPLVAGNTEVAIEMKLKNMEYPVMIAVTHIPELNIISSTDKGVKFGSSVTLTDIEATLRAKTEDLPEHKSRMWKAVVEMLQWFSGCQTRNIAVVGGNIATCSPISDLNPLFLAAGAELEVAATDGSRRKIKMDEHFFLGYRMTSLKPNEILLSITLPYCQEDEYFMGYKQAHRKGEDISIVNAGFRVLFEEKTDVIKEISLAFGGMAATTVLAVRTCSDIVGRRWDDTLLDDTLLALSDELILPPDAPGGMTEYRRSLTMGFFFKFYITVKLDLEEKIPEIEDKVSPLSYTAISELPRELTKSCQEYEEVPEDQDPDDPIGRSIPILSGLKHATGETIFIDDMPQFEGELYLALVTSTKAHAKILNVDTNDAMRVKGVVDYISFKDVEGSNTWGFQPEESFASSEVLCVGQVIGAIVADTQIHAQTAAKKVHIEYQELDAIITIKQAIEKESFFGEPKVLTWGDPEKGLRNADHVLEGEVHIGGQEHFYLETNATLAVPKNEDGEIELFVSSQNPSHTQMVVANALGISSNKVVVKVKRIGGGFGGKETRNLCLTVPVAVAAQKLGKPVRCMLERHEDMTITGTRQPFLGQYKVGFDNDGEIMCADIDLFSNAGCTLDLCELVLNNSFLKIDNAYRIKNLKITGRICKTNIPSNTGFRGFGSPQARLVTESIIDHMAMFLRMPPEKVRLRNLYTEGDTTHYGQEIDDAANLTRCWEECMTQSDYNWRRKEVDIYNSKSMWKKRGVCIIPTMYGLGFDIPWMNQAGALVSVYRDGSVSLTHGGVETGQGLQTKMTQVASKSLKIPMSKIHILGMSTDKVPNTSPTASSSSSDLNGKAVQAACTTILERLQPYVTAKPDGKWEDWVDAAYHDRVNLSATGFYKTPDLTGYNFETHSGTKTFSYFTFGAACSEVEIDCLTGDHRVIRTDIVMDVGKSLNPAIDIGQIEGAFVQGYGLFLLEQQKVTPDGNILSRGPGSYKIPGFNNAPLEFNVTLLKPGEDPVPVSPSKGIGEPPLFLSASVFFAVKEAVRSARAETFPLEANFQFNSPATPERIRMACIDKFTIQGNIPDEETEDEPFDPYFVEQL